MYNLFSYSRIYLNLLINKVKRQKGSKDYYDVDQSNLISRIKIDIVEAILNPSKIKEFMKIIIEKCTPGPNKVDKPRKYERNKKTINKTIQTQHKQTF